MTTQSKTRKVRPSTPVDGPRAYLLDLMAELDRASISLRLGQSLKEAGIRQPEMAELLHLHKSAIEQYVSPRVKTVPFDRLDEWARLTGTTKEWLLHGDSKGGDAIPPGTLTELLSEVRSTRLQVQAVLEQVSSLEAELRESGVLPPSLPESP